MVTKEQVIEALKLVEDPELFLDVWFLGLIYHINLQELENNKTQVNIEMTFTSPMCPAGPQLIADIKEKVGAIEEVSEVDITVVFVPPWQPSDEVKETLGIS
jgi:metal-sulfur cluster biosynthetic enzyme